MSDQSEEKSEQATDKKLRKEREKGKALTAAESVAAVVVAVLLGYTIISFLKLSADVGVLFDFTFAGLGDPDFKAQMDSLSIFSSLVVRMFVTLLGISATAAVLMTVVIQGGIVFSTEPLVPKMERIDPVKRFLEWFKIRALTELGIAILKFVAWAVIAGLVFYYMLPDILGMMDLNLIGMLQTAAWILISIIMIAIVLLCAILAIDLPLQKFLFGHDMKMTKTDVKRERKDSSGDPKLKSARKKIMKEMVENPVGIDHTSFVAVGPSGVVGIKYIHGETNVPSLTLRQSGDAAAGVCRQAKAKGIPVVEQADLVEVLQNGIGVGNNLHSNDAVDPFVSAYRKSLSI